MAERHWAFFPYREKKPPRVRTCPSCGGEFNLRDNQPDEARYCSLSCAARDREVHGFASSWARRRLPDFICRECGKTFKTNKGRRAKYCSRECYRASGSPIHKKINMAGRPRGADLIIHDDPPPPDEETIRQLCLEIQAEWDEETRLERLRFDWRPVNWTAPIHSPTKRRRKPSPPLQLYRDGD